MDFFYTLLKPIVEPLTWLLDWFHNTVGLPWAWAIVALTVVVRIAMIPLTVKQQQSFRAMQVLQPEIKKLQTKYKGDRQKLNEEMMLFYKENKVNPFGSCLPILVQLPIFFGLYQTLRNLNQEVQAGDDLAMFWGWIPDITLSLNSLPASTLYPLMAIYVLSQVGSTLLMPTSMDPKQKYIFLFLPIVFAYFIVSPPFGTASFPAGLLVYWITTNLWTCGQAAVIRVWFPPPLPPSAKVQASKPTGTIAQRLGIGKAPAPNAMPKAKKPKVSTASAEAAVVVEAKPAVPSKVQRSKRPVKPKAAPKSKPTTDGGSMPQGDQKDS